MVFKVLLFSFCIFAVACQKSGFVVTQIPSGNVGKQADPVTSPPVPPSLPTTPIFKAEPLLWDVARIDGPKWSKFVFDLFKNDRDDAIHRVTDMDLFCPKYSTLDDDQRANAMAMLVSGMVKFESSFDPTSRYRETTMGTDPITGQPVYSEGLMQLSYQDLTSYSFCQFDWSKDRNLSATDPRKTILDPYLNLDCGVKILTDQIRRTGKVVIDSGAYWAVIKGNGRYEKISEIAALVKTLSFCK